MSQVEGQNGLSNIDSLLFQESQKLAKVGTWVYDRRTQIYSCSDEIYTIFGANSEIDHPSYKKFYAFCHPDDREVISTYLHFLTNKHKDVDFTFRIIQPNGEIRTLRETGRCLPDTNGETIGFIGAIHDITDYQLEHKSPSSESNTEPPAFTSTAEFLSGMNHDLRTPLHGIMGFSQLLIDDNLTSQQELHARSILESGHQLTQTIDNILAYSELESTVSTLNSTPFNLPDIIREISEAVSGIVTLKQIEFITGYDEDTPSAFIGDPVRLKQILQNLIGNAIKYTESGYVLINIEKTLMDSQNVVITIEIKDTGIGLAKQHLKTLASSFAFDLETRTQVVEGLGLGLALSSTLTHLMGGKIHITSEIHKGTVVTLQIPMAIDHRNDTKIDTDPWHGEKILIIDPITTRRDALSALLTTFGISCTTVLSVTEAFHHISNAAKEDTPFWLTFIDSDSLFANQDKITEAFLNDKTFKEVALLLCTPATGSIFDTTTIQHIINGEIPRPLTQTYIKEILTTLWTYKQNGERPTLPALSTSHAAPTLFSRFPSAKILLVEDNRFNQTIALSFLHEWGCNVELAVNGQEAIDLATRSQFDLILMDIQMPIMDGLEATRILREKGFNTPIIATTAHTQAAYRKRCSEAGMNDFISKPVTQKALHHTLSKHLQGSIEPPLINNKPTQPETTTDKPVTTSDSNVPQELFSVFQALKSAAGNVDILQQLISIIQEDLPQRLADFQEALSAGDATTAGRQAHTIRGQAVHFKAENLIEVSEALEAMADDEKFDQMKELAPALMAAADELLSWFPTLDWEEVKKIAELEFENDI